MNCLDISEVERLAGLMFSADEVCIITQISYAEYAQHDGFQQAMLRGRLKQEAEVRASIMENAKAGSSPAQTLATQLIHAAHVAAAGV